MLTTERDGPAHVVIWWEGDTQPPSQTHINPTSVSRWEPAACGTPSRRTVTGYGVSGVAMS